MQSRAIFLSVGVFFTVLLGQFVSASEQDIFLRQRMIGDLDFIKNTFQTNYANIEWKRTYAGWDLEQEIDSAKLQVLSSNHFTTKDFQALIKKFCLSTKDYHVEVEFYSTEIAVLPFLVQSANKRYFFTHIEEDQNSRSKKMPFEVGDELISIDGISIHQVIEKIKAEEIGANQPATDQAMAEMHLTTRLGMLGQTVPHGAVTITGRRKKSSKTIDHVMEWSYIPEKISNFTPGLSKNMMAPGFPKITLAKQTPKRAKFYTKEFILPQYRALTKARAAEEDMMEIMGAKQSCLPSLGHIIWEAPEHYNFQAYIFEMPNGIQAGFVRIATYSPTNLEKAAEEFAEIIGFFQEETQLLVIDQLNNPGGSVLYMYALASMLTDRPLLVPQHRQMITQEEVFFAISELASFEDVKSDEDAIKLLGNSFEGVFVNLELVQSLAKYLHHTIDEWTAGRMFTQPGYIYGIGPLMPSPHANYTKPILVLINALDYSGGDFFPAILQDNARATLMGTKTAGAGGYVSKVTFPNLNGIISLSYTASMAKRPDNHLIENEGVTPDIAYEVTERDLQKNYIDYVRKIQKVMETL